MTAEELGSLGSRYGYVRDYFEATYRVVACAARPRRTIWAGRTPGIEPPGREGAGPRSSRLPNIHRRAHGDPVLFPQEDGIFL